MADTLTPNESAKYQAPVAYLATKPFPPEVREEVLPEEADKVVLPPPVQQNKFKPGAIAKQEYVSGHKGLFYSQFIKSLPAFDDELTDKLGDDIYDKMMFDPQVYSCFHILKTAILSDPGKVVSPIQNEEDPRYELAKEIAEFCERCLTYLDTPFIDVLYELLDGVGLGHKVAEIIFDVPTEGIDAGKWVPKSIRCKLRGSTSFLVDAYMRIIGLVATIPGMAYPIIAGQLITQPESIPNLLPREKFMIFTYNPKNGDPRGRPANRCIYNPWWAKQQTWGEMLKVLGQFGTPSLWANVAEMASAQVDESTGTLVSPQQALLNVLKDLQGGSIAVVPFGSEINAIPASGDVTTHINAINLFDRQIAKGLLSQTLATEEGEHMSRAASETHQDTMSLGVRTHKDRVSFMVKKDLFHTLVRYNYGEQAARELTPNYQLVDMNKADWGSWSAIAVQLYQSGYITGEQKKWLDDKLGLPKTKAGEAISAVAERSQAEQGMFPDQQAPGGPGGEGEAQNPQDQQQQQPQTPPTQVASVPPQQQQTPQQEPPTMVRAQFGEVLKEFFDEMRVTFAASKVPPGVDTETPPPPPAPARVPASAVQQYQHIIRKFDPETGTYRSNFTGRFRDEAGGNHYFVNGHRTTKGALKAHSETNDDHFTDDYRSGWEAVHVANNTVRPLKFSSSPHAFDKSTGAGYHEMHGEPVQQKIVTPDKTPLQRVMSGESKGAQETRDYASTLAPKQTVRYPEQGAEAQAKYDAAVARQAAIEQKHAAMVQRAREIADAKAAARAKSGGDIKPEAGDRFHETYYPKLFNKFRSGDYTGPDKELLQAASQQRDLNSIQDFRKFANQFGTEQIPNHGGVLSPQQQQPTTTDAPKVANLPTPQQTSVANSPQQTESGYPKGSAQDKAYVLGQKVRGGLASLSQVGLAALHHAGTAEKSVKDFFASKMEHVPEHLRNAVAGAVKLTYAPYIAANKAVEKVAGTLGMSEPQQRGTALAFSVLDVLGAKAVPVGVYAATGSVGAAIASAFVPVGSMAFLAYQGTRMAPMILRRAQQALANIDWTYLQNAPDVPEETGKTDAKFSAGVDPEMFSKLFFERTRGLNKEKTDLFTAVFCLAMDHSRDMQQSLDAASQAVGGEGKAQFGDYASTQFDIADAGYVRSQGNPAHDILKIGSLIPDSDLAKNGRESIPHITVKYGIHAQKPEPIAEIVKRNTGVIEANIGSTDYFSCDGYDVVILKVYSDGLKALNKAISDGAECTDTHHEYKPHITIAYVKSGLGPKYSGLNVFSGHRIYLSRLIFSDTTRRRHVIDLKDGSFYLASADFSLDETISDLSALYQDVTEMGDPDEMMRTMKRGIREGANSVYELFKFNDAASRSRAKAIVKAFIKEQNEYLENYIRNVRDGQDFPLPSRSSMYAAALRKLSEHLVREKAKSMGARWERRVLGAVDHHCSECLAEARRGWQRIGTLAPIGTLQCLVNCGCSMEYGFGKKPKKADNGKMHDHIASFDKIPGGLAEGKRPSDFDRDALAAGIKVEMEHTDDPKIALEIAMDHLTEDPDYYKKLKKMEASSSK